MSPARTLQEKPVERVTAVIFDTDGVVTRTASVHRTAWKSLFDQYLRERADSAGTSFVPFSDDDYTRFVDGRSRYDGVEAFLVSRDIRLPRGEPTDPAGTETACALGNTKNGYFLAEVADSGVEPFASTLSLVRALRRRGIRTAVVSASENCAHVIEAAGAGDLFDLRVDGLDTAALGLPGKPDPALFLEAARRLDVSPADAAVVEDALAGVEAGRRGGFGLVVGVDRAGIADELADHGADVVVEDLAAFDIDETGRWTADAVAGETDG